jgi:DNA repair protein RadC
MNGIKSWAEDDRPREKLMQKGADALSNSELLAILINNGTTNASAVQLAQQLLQKCKNNLQVLSRCTYKEIVAFKIKGLGPAKAIAIAAALELGLRRETETLPFTKINGVEDIGPLLQRKYQHKNHEVFCVVFLNNANKILHIEEISEGGIMGTVVDPRIIFKKALEHNAVSLILCHNHPSGNLKPSNEDKKITQKLKEAALLLDLKVQDHIIVSSDGYYSFAEAGAL